VSLEIDATRSLVWCNAAVAIGPSAIFEEGHGHRRDTVQDTQLHPGPLYGAVERISKQARAQN